MNARSIRFQLLVWYAALIVAGFAAFGYFMYAALGSFLRQNLRETVSRRAFQIARGIAAQPRLSAQWLQNEISAHYAPETSGRFVRVTSGWTNVVYASGVPHDRSFDPAEVPLPGQPQTRQSFRVQPLADGAKLMITALPVAGTSPPLLVEVGTPLGPVESALWNLVESLLIGAPILIAITGIGAYVLIGRALRPAVRIAASAEHITLHNLDERLPAARSGDELETLSLALNRMIGRIRESFENTRRFIADASHELRTPIAVLRGEIEAVMNRHDLTQETRESLGSNLEEVERLGKIVEGLFALSRLDAGEAHAESVRFDLAALAAMTTEQLCLLAEDKNISLKCEFGGPVFVEGDRARLKQVIVNLLDNAIKYTPEGGIVSVRIYKADSEAALDVTDNGIGIPEEALAHIFERFYRVDKARSRDLGGAGLGLSIVRSICHAHSGRVVVQSREGSGSVFSVRIPLSRTDSISSLTL